MKSFNHQNLVKFIGVFVTSHSLDLLMEYIGGGTLNKYIQQINQNISPLFSSKQLYSIAYGISSGMVL